MPSIPCAPDEYTGIPNRKISPRCWKRNCASLISSASKDRPPRMLHTGHYVYTCILPHSREAIVLALFFSTALPQGLERPTREQNTTGSTNLCIQFPVSLAPFSQHTSWSLALAFRERSWLHPTVPHAALRSIIWASSREHSDYRERKVALGNCT